MDNEKQLTEKESLELITQMINKAKDACHDTGVTTIMWGAVIICCSLVRFAELHFDFRLPFDIYLLTFLAVIPQIYFNVREKKRRKVKTYDEQFMDSLWTAFGISIALLIYINSLLYKEWDVVNDQYVAMTGKGGFKLYEYTASFFLLLYGMPTFVTGMTMKFKPMFWGGLLCWACCLLSLYTPVKTDLLLIALSAAGAWLIPGIIMEKDYQMAKKQLVQPHV
ncbi:MAG: hypothetical protein IPP99_09260 [Chitinophagaceae bacterium]|nr:hypothetical protein [Chitinophagaceae bacterium]